MKGKIITFILIFLLTSNFVFALDMTEGVVINDNTNTYTVIQNYSINTLQVSNGEIYTNSQPFCSWDDRGYLETLRECLKVLRENPFISETTLNLLGVVGVILIGGSIFIIVNTLRKKHKFEKDYRRVYISIATIIITIVVIYIIGILVDSLFYT